jgi:flagellar secretion chaperone FliS
VNSYKAYQQRTAAGQPRIDVILSLYEALIARLEKALAALRRGDQTTARQQLAACNLGIAGLVTAVAASGGELARNFLNVYGFVVRCLKEGSESKVQSALNGLRMLHEGFLAIRPQALQMERSGEIPPLEQGHSFQVRA